MSRTSSADSLPARILTGDSAGCPINKLPDSILAKIFTRLSFKERFLACHVTKKWAAASRIPWSDIIYLDVSSIPRAMLNPILALCPKIQHMHAEDSIIILNDNDGSVPICDQLRVLKLASVQFAMKGLDHNDRSFQKFKQLVYRFLAQFPNLTELIWSDILAVNWHNHAASPCDNYSRPYSTRLMFHLPNSIGTCLKRLVVADSRPVAVNSGNLPIDLALPFAMLNLECLHVDHHYEAYGNILGAWLSQANASHLRELGFVSRSFPLEFPQKGGFRFEQLAEIVCQKHPRLEVLIYAGHNDMSPAGLGKIIETPHPALRILVLSGTDLVLMAKHILYEGDPQVTPTLPPRPSISANGAARCPLEIFAGGNFTNHVRFTHSPQSNIVHYHRIDCPMSQFLAKPEFESFFEGLWTAETLRDGPNNGLKEWGEGGPGLMSPFYVDTPLQFH